LDFRPKAGEAARAKMIAMNTARSDKTSASPRRLVLLPEESVDGHGRRPRIRRYQLARVGWPDDARGADQATAGMARVPRSGKM
jgi:hypothetical protein